MPAKLKKEDAKKILSNVPDDRVFFLNNGGVIRNMAELAEVLKGIDGATFKHHVTPERNDFSNWLSDVVSDKKIAKDISKVKTIKTMHKKVSQRVVQLKKYVGK